MEYEIRKKYQIPSPRRKPLRFAGFKCNYRSCRGVRVNETTNSRSQFYVISVSVYVFNELAYLYWGWITSWPLRIGCRKKFGKVLLAGICAFLGVGGSPAISQISYTYDGCRQIPCEDLKCMWRPSTLWMRSERCFEADLARLAQVRKGSEG